MEKMGIRLKKLRQLKKLEQVDGLLTGGVPAMYLTKPQRDHLIYSSPQNGRDYDIEVGVAEKVESSGWLERQ